VGAWIETVTTPEMIKKVTEAWELSRNLEAEGGRSRYIGTRYHYNDTYATILDRGAAIPRIYPATISGKSDGEPISIMTRERLLEKRREMGPYVFSAQMLLDPTADEVQGFSENWLKYWPATQYKGLNISIICDPASEKKKDNDYTCFMVLGLGADKNFYIITMVRDRLNLTERANVLFALHRQFRGVRNPDIYYERYGMQCDIEHYQDRMNRENYRFSIKEVAGSVGKFDRIRSLIPLFEQGRIYLPETCIRVNYEKISEDLTKLFIKNEYVAFPYCIHDDMLDCLARITDPEFSQNFPDYVEGPIGHDLEARRRMIEDGDDRDDYDPLRDYLRARA